MAQAASKLRARFKVDVTLEYSPAAGASKAKVDSAVSWKKLVQVRRARPCRVSVGQRMHMTASFDGA